MRGNLVSVLVRRRGEIQIYPSGYPRNRATAQDRGVFMISFSVRSGGFGVKALAALALILLLVSGCEKRPEVAQITPTGDPKLDRLAAAMAAPIDSSEFDRANFGPLPDYDLYEDPNLAGSIRRIGGDIWRELGGSRVRLGTAREGCKVKSEAKISPSRRYIAIPVVEGVAVASTATTETWTLRPPQGSVAVACWQGDDSIVCRMMMGKVDPNAIVRVPKTGPVG